MITVASPTGFEPSRLDSSNDSQPRDPQGDGETENSRSGPVELILDYRVVSIQ
jgi:hypothetical protein